LLLIASSLAIAMRFAGDRRRGWAWFYATAIPIVFAILVAVGYAFGGNPLAFAALATPWIWVTTLAGHLFRIEAVARGESLANQAV
jgi:hypothetical protein